MRNVKLLWVMLLAFLFVPSITKAQTSARKPSSGEVSAARKAGAGKTSTAAPQNGQNEPVAAATHLTVAMAI